MPQYFLLKFVWILLQIVAGLSFLFPVLLMLITSVRRLRKGKEQIHTQLDFAIIVTAYQQTDLLQDVVDSILHSDHQLFHVYIVADDCDITSLYFETDRVSLLKPEIVLASNIGSHLYAMQRFIRNHDVITIIDSDNVIQYDYLSQLNTVFNAGFQCVQGVRAARNLNTIYARLDEAGDMFYRFIDRKLLYEAGSSASLAGSGMAFKTSLYEECLKKFDISGAGFDKMLQYELVKDKYRIAFCERAVLFDAKTAKSGQLVKQRARWINTWFKYWRLAFKLFFKSIRHLNWNQFAFAVMLLRPPLFLLFGGVLMFIFVDAFLMPEMIIFWVLMFVLFLFTFFKALAYNKADATIYRSLVQIPKFIFFQILALFRARKANQISVATKHDVATYKKAN